MSICVATSISRTLCGPASQQGLHVAPQRSRPVLSSQVVGALQFREHLAIDNLPKLSLIPAHQSGFARSAVTVHPSREDFRGSLCGVIRFPSRGLPRGQRRSERSAYTLCGIFIWRLEMMPQSRRAHCCQTNRHVNRDLPFDAWSHGPRFRQSNAIVGSTRVQGRERSLRYAAVDTWCAVP
jgi:hypothetical protein